MKIPIIYWLLEYTLKLFNLWPDKGINIIGMIFFLSTLVFTLPFQCWDCTKIKKPTLLMDSGCHIIDEILIILKIFVILRNRRELISLLQEIARDYNKKEVSDKWSTLEYEAHLFCKFDYTWYLGAITLYILQFLFQYIKVPVEQRELLLKSYYPFNYKSSPIYEIISFLHVIQIFSITSVNSMSESLLVALIIHACGHINLLNDEIKMFSNTCNSTSNRYKKENSQLILSKVWKKHLKFLNIVNKIECIYSYVSLFQVLISTLTICAAGFVIITAIEENDVLHIVKFSGMIFALMWQAFSFCFAGQYLINKNETIIYTLYNIFWYNKEPKDIKALLFIIKRTQSPLVLTAGKFLTLSTESFLMIIKTSFSYLSVLRVTYS